MIKICGLTTDDCIDCCQAEGVDAVGFNCYPRSPRYLAIDEARRLRLRISVPMEVVGVFVRPSVEELRRAVEELELDVVQIHGADAEYWRMFEPPNALLWLAQGVSSLAEITHLRLQEKLCKSMNVTVSSVLVDARVEGLEGGTGQVAPWNLLQETTWTLPLVLAGGLTPGNVRQAIEQVRPYGVDVASGVESSPGVKDALKVREFVKNARAALR